MTKSWWPFKRRAKTVRIENSAQNSSEPEQQLIDTARDVKRQALRSVVDSEPTDEEARRPTTVVHKSVTHVNFHRACRNTIAKKDPITRKIKRVPKVMDRTNAYYTRDGRLITDNFPGA